MPTDDGIEWISGSPEEFRRKLKDPRLVGEPARNFFKRALIHLQGLIRENAPKDTSNMRDNVTFDIDQSPTPLWGKVGTNVHYAPAQEYGTRALSEKPSMTGNTPFPTGPDLDVWAKRHDWPSGATVAAAIRRNGGIIPKRFMRISFHQAKDKLNQFVEQMGAEIEERWGK